MREKYIQVITLTLLCTLSDTSETKDFEALFQPEELHKFKFKVVESDNHDSYSETNDSPIGANAAYNDDTVNQERTVEHQLQLDITSVFTGK